MIVMAFLAAVLAVGLLMCAVAFMAFMAKFALRLVFLPFIIIGAVIKLAIMVVVGAIVIAVIIPIMILLALVAVPLLVVKAVV